MRARSAAEIGDGAGRCNHAREFIGGPLIQLTMFRLVVSPLQREQQNPRSPYYGLVVPAYQASKAALNSVTIALAKSLSLPVKVTSVCPGWVQTDLGGPDNRAAAPITADQAARVVVAAACLPADEPSGQFLDATGTVPW